jgi:general secretion pathway protein G
MILKSKIRNSRRALRRGFTLIELLVVIVILAILAAVVIQRVTHRTEDARISKAIADVKSLDDALETYKLDTGTYPSGDQGLAALMDAGSSGNNNKWNGPYIKGSLPRDAWGNEYVYRFPGEHGEYDILSPGPETQVGTADDIGNWQR